MQLREHQVLKNGTFLNELKKTKDYSFRIPNYGLFSFKSQTLFLPSIFLNAIQTKRVLAN